MNRFSKTALLVLVGWGLSGVAAAQTATAPPTPPRVVTAAERDKMTVEMAAAQGGTRLMATVETRVTTGRPYSAEAVTESLQVLGDGNRISKSSTTRVYRDNEGRTRREQLEADGSPRAITISDPVGHASFTLDPRTKTAFRSAQLALTAPSVVPPSGYGTGRGSGTGGSSGTAVAGGTGGGTGRAAWTTEAQKSEVERRRTANVEMAETSQAAAGQMKQVLEYAASGGRQTTKENLGEQMIEGVRATGTRNTTVIPAGAIGNMNEIRIVSEQWFSPDLEVLVLTRHSDPRVGETVYKLTNIVRAQPDPNLFTVPADYTVKGRSVRNQ